MGKIKHKKPSQTAKTSLEDDIRGVQFVKPKERPTKVRHRQNEEEEYVDSNLSKKILRAARDQQRELESLEGNVSNQTPKRTKLSKINNDSSEESDTEEGQLDPDAYDGNIEIKEEDEKAMEKFMNLNAAPCRTLADIIMEKITEKQTEIETQFSDAGTMQLEKLDPEVKQMYERVGDVLKKYRSGKVPKAFKWIPKLKNWEQILYLTDPTGWSAAAMFMGTRIFASNLKENMAQRFYNLVLLPRIRDDLAEYKRLNFHLYQALRKALFKPGAFMKGIILPLLESGNCSLREAIIIGSVVVENSIPILHSAAALLKIAEMEYTGANSIFLRILFDKRYALPYRVVDAAVFHFLRFERDPREMPVLWHQALLTFVQRYKADISSEQRDSLLQLLKKQSHHKITPEIRRELQNAKCRDLETAEPKMDF